MHNCQPLHHLLQHTSFRNSVIFTLLAITHYFVKYHHLDKIVVFTAISCTCITANLSITSFNVLVSSTLSSLPFLQPLITSQNILILTKNSRLYLNFLYLYNCQSLHHLLQLTSFRKNPKNTHLNSTHQIIYY